MIGSTINIAAYALAGAAVFILVAVVGIVITTKVVKNLGSKAEEERDKEEVIIKNNPVAKQQPKVEHKPNKKMDKKEDKKAETLPTKKMTNSKELIFIKLGNVQQQERFFLTSSNSLNIGRGKEKNEWILTDDHTVSQKHCKIYITDDQVYIMDLNSTNGTYVNKQMISYPMQLQNEDILRIGVAEYRIIIRD